MSLEIKLGSRIVSEDSEQEVKISGKIITLGAKQKSELFYIQIEWKVLQNLKLVLYNAPKNCGETGGLGPLQGV